MADFITTRILQEPPTGLGRPHRVRRFLIVSTVVLIALSTIWAGYAVSTGHYALLLGVLVLFAISAVPLSLLRTGWSTAEVHLLLISLLA